MSNRTLQGISFMVSGALAFATMSALIKVACRELPALEVVFARGLFGLIVLSVLELRSQGRLTPGGDRRRLFLRSIFGFVGVATYVWAIAHIGLGVSSALNQSSPVFVALFSFLFLRERVPRAVPFLVLVAFLGAWMIISPDFRNVDWETSVGLLSGICAGAAYIYVRKLRRTDAPWTIVRWFSGWSVALSLPSLLWGGWAWPDGRETLALLGVGVFGLLGQIAMTNAYRVERASVVSPFMYVGVLGSLTYGAVIWDEWPSPVALGGVTLIIIASLLIGWLSSRQAPALARSQRPPQ